MRSRPTLADSLRQPARLGPYDRSHKGLAAHVSGGTPRRLGRPERVGGPNRMSVLELCAGRRALSGFIGLSMLSCVLPQPTERGPALWIITGLAVVLLGWAFACSVLPGFTCNITVLTVVASTFWATYGTYEALVLEAGGQGVIKLTLAAFMGSLYVAFDLGGSRVVVEDR